MPDVSALTAFEPRHDFLIAIDSDGCVFDSMELKHKECFCPAFIKHYELQRVSAIARETWEFVNLYSTHRGANRFGALRQALRWLGERPEAIARGLELPPRDELEKWIEEARSPDHPGLQAAVEAGGGPQLKRARQWSEEVNQAVAALVQNLPPFPSVRSTLEKMREHAEAFVVSQTPTEALEREWAEHEIDGLVEVIAGQEMGSKADILKVASEDRYDRDKVLMIGDAPGDLRAAEAAGVHFYPILPGSENESWERLRDEALDQFFKGTYGGRYEQGRCDTFLRLLPNEPGWPRSPLA